GTAQKHLALAKRQFINPVGLEGMSQSAAGIGPGIATSVGECCDIDPWVAERVRLRGKALGKGIIGFHQQSLRQSPAYFHLQSVIVAKTSVAYDIDSAQEVWIGHEEVRRQASGQSVVTERPATEQTLRGT